ncbi:MAG: four helix bundle protein [Chitinophagales bacterium]|nr:four helix bundle protein [Chitinophagales bacterium]
MVQKTVKFTLSVIDIYKYLKSNKGEFILSKQLMRSASAIGALVHEAQEAESKRDFIHKMTIALKEARETEYWFQIVLEANYINAERIKYANIQLQEILRILTAIVKTSKIN